MNKPSFGLTLAALGTSFVLHGVAYASLPAVRAFGWSEQQSEVVMEIAAPKRPVEPPPAKAPERVEPEPERPAPAPRPAAPQPKAVTPPAPEPTPVRAPVDLRGVTLTNDGDGSFASVVGDGSSSNGPIRAPVAMPARPAPAPPPSVAPVVRAPALVAASDLSSRPEPPPLDEALRRNYPPEAERQGIGGSASVRARIEPDGRVRAASVIAETFPGFGDACRRTLVGSRWSAPRDREGRPVATEIRYTCRFVVAR